MSQHLTPAAKAAEYLRVALYTQRKPQREIADLLGLSQVAVSRRLNGAVPLDLNEFVTIARHLGLDPAQVLADTTRTGEATA